MDAEQLTLPLDNNETITLSLADLDMTGWCADGRRAALAIIGAEPNTWTGTRRELAKRVLSHDATLWAHGLGKFWGPDMRGCDFSGWRMEFPDLSGGDFSDCDFSDSTLIGLLAKETVLRGCNFDRADISTAEEDFVVADFYQSSFQEANLDGCNFNGVMIGCNFKGANISRVAFEECDLEGANFEVCSLSDCNFEYVTLDGASFNGALISNVVSKSSTIKGATMRDAKIHDGDVADLLVSSGGDVELTGSTIDVKIRLHDEKVARAFAELLKVLQEYE
jgi:uncharacterized protein YjbI with pentapeptide repeats